jgi:hypothetical protein
MLSSSFINSFKAYMAEERSKSCIAGGNVRGRNKDVYMKYMNLLGMGEDWILYKSVVYM